MSLTEERNKMLAHSYGWMALSLLISLLSAIGFCHTQLFQMLLAYERSGMTAFLIAIIFLGFEWFLMYAIAKVARQSVPCSAILLGLFSIVDGCSLAYIFAFYSLNLIFIAFLVTVVVFGSMSMIGILTKKNLHSWYKTLMAMMIALIVVSLIEICFHTALVILITSLIGVVIFSLLTVADSNRIWHSVGYYKGASIVGAISLYIDFIALFQYFVEILGMFSEQRS